MTSKSKTSEQAKTDCVHVLEVTAISLGAIALIGAAILGLGNKLTTNMHQPKRSEKIAKHLIKYQFPETSQGQMGLSIGAEAFAVVTDRPENPSLRLFVQASPVDKVERTSTLVREYAQNAGARGIWDYVTDENKSFRYCNQTVNLKINRGFWAVDENAPAVNAIEYTLDATVRDYDQTIQILATGLNAEARAKQLLDSIQCRQQLKK
jgi:hypothetical protein